MPLPSNNPNYPYEPARCPILEAWPEFANFSGSGKLARDVEIAKIIEVLALAYGGSGYRYHGEFGRERERER